MGERLAFGFQPLKRSRSAFLSNFLTEVAAAPKGWLGGEGRNGDGLTEQGRHAQALASAVHPVGRAARRGVPHDRRHCLPRQELAQLLVGVFGRELAETLPVPS